ncbi:unnamed protein product [Symbiodinium natans]|uniref:Uncharacterized protein n=1 Tax=Symbiodinium natans TaxID=878477 RepID=A0A812I401_9DINO|nr:unnamed protein product [Symbiodinium natans]
MHVQHRAAEVRTACSAQPSFATYAVRVVCVDEDGGRVLHTFQQGGFDAQETFDTSIRCHRCETGDSIKVPQLAATSSGAQSAGLSASQEALQERWVASQKLSSLEKEVRLLTNNEMQMKQEIEDLQARLNRSESRALRGSENQKEGGGIKSRSAAEAHSAPSAHPNQQSHFPPHATSEPGARATVASPGSGSAVEPSVATVTAAFSSSVPLPAVAASALQDSTIAVSAEHAAQEAEKAAAEAELEAQGVPSAALQPAPAATVAGSGQSGQEDLEDEKLVSLLDDADAGDT